MGRRLTYLSCTIFHSRQNFVGNVYCYDFILISMAPACGRSFFSLATQVNSSETGALRGLIGKSGERPVRSRHCNEERTQDMPLERKFWEGLGEQ